MNPIHKEKYVLSKETFGYVTIEQHKPKLNRNKRNIKLTALVQIVVGTIFVASVIATKQSGMFAFTVFAIIMIGLGIHGLMVKHKKYDKQVWESIEKTYNAREYGDNWFEVKFFEDRMKYLVGGNTDELLYNDFTNFYESENYFCIHFITGDLIIFNPDCDREKIKDIILSFRKKGEEMPAVEAVAEEVATEEVIAEETVAETVEE